MSDDSLTVEGTGDTVGEARWAALRELERQVGTVDQTQVEIVVVSEGERGLLGVGKEPARVLAKLSGIAPAVAAVPEVAPEPIPQGPLGDAAQAALRVVDAIAQALGPGYRVHVSEDAERGIVLDITGGDPGPIIGRHGATIDAIEHLAAAVAFPPGADRLPIAVDAQGYRARRERRLRELAEQAATQALSENAPMELDPMSAAERKVVHLALADREDVETSSDGREPERFVVVWPRGSAPASAG
ncbi:MAG TPA: RNA-binding cell elongation regulator Jag/EloR [Gaiellales bacterium]|jgi:spoIIIJ-associated protein